MVFFFKVKKRKQIHFCLDIVVNILLVVTINSAITCNQTINFLDINSHIGLLIYAGGASLAEMPISAIAVTMQLQSAEMAVSAESDG